MHLMPHESTSNKLARREIFCFQTPQYLLLAKFRVLNLPIFGSMICVGRIILFQSTVVSVIGNVGRRVEHGDSISLIPK